MNITEVIKFEGPQDALVWKNSGEDYNVSGDEKLKNLTQLIVDEFYEAIFFANGNALDLFKPGKYTLTTNTIPMLSKAYENQVNGTPFPCKVYYINKVHQLELKWGTQGAITINDPIYEIFLHVGCCGTMAIKIADSRKFLLKFVGNKNIFGNQDLINNLRGLISSRVKDYISKIMINGKVSFFDMNAHIYDVGLMIQEQLAPVFLEYGIAIELFNIETIDVPREDYDSISKAKELKTSRKIQGFSWQEEKKFEVMDSMAKNEGSGSGIMNAGLGMGVGLGVGGAMGGSFSKLANSVFSDQPQAQPQSVAPESVNSSVENKNVDVNSIIKPSGESVAPSKKYCTNCGQELNIDAKFCSKCGNRV